MDVHVTGMHTWDVNIADVVRDLFGDEELKDLMLIPEEDRNSIVAFRDKYFVNQAISDHLLFNQDVRVLYVDENPTESNSEHVMYHRIYCHIFVRNTQAYTYGEDRMLHRGGLIAVKLKRLFCNMPHQNIRFTCRGIYDLASKMEGYDHKCVVLRYKRIYT